MKSPGRKARPRLKLWAFLPCFANEACADPRSMSLGAIVGPKNLSRGGDTFKILVLDLNRSKLPLLDPASG